MKRNFDYEFEWTSKKKRSKQNIEKNTEHDDINWEKITNTTGYKTNIVSVDKNIIYFNGKVSLESILDLKKAIQKLNDKYIDLKSHELLESAVASPIYLKITSYGGSVIAAMSAIDCIRKSIIPIHTIIDGCAASAATLMSIVGVKRYITPSSYMLIHQLSSGVCGTHAEIEDEYNNCEMMMNDIKNLYIKYTKLKKSQLNNFLKHDIWWKTDECLKYKLVDEIY